MPSDHELNRFARFGYEGPSMSPLHTEAESYGREILAYGDLDDVEKQGNGSISNINGNREGQSITER